MKEILVKDILHLINGKILCGEKTLELNNFCKDTREIKPGDMYIGIKGENFDGSLFFEQALKKGASGCIVQGVEVEESIINNYKDKTIILVKDTVKALGQIASYKRSLYNIPVIGVTGSVGKTSTKDLIASVISKKYKVLKTEGNLNNNIGLPLTILGLKDHEALIVEMGMNHSGEISVLTNIAKPTIAVISNVGTAHIGNLGSRENILKAKLEIIQGLDKDGPLILNNDNDLLNMWNNSNNCIKTYTYGIDNLSDINAFNINIGEESSTYNIKVEDKVYNVIVPVSGRHFIYNSLCAILVGLRLNINMEKILQGIKEFKLTKNRMDIQKIKYGITVVNDTYNASYDSMKEAINYIGSVKNKRKIAVLGDMLELGDFAKQLHEQIAYDIIDNNIDVLITVGELAQYILNKCIELGMDKGRAYNTRSNQQVINMLNEIMQADDIILLKASNGMKFSEILNGIL